jgi:hypothetical protein
MTTAASASSLPSRIASIIATMFDPRPDMRIAIFGFAIRRENNAASINTQANEKRTRIQQSANSQMASAHLPRNLMRA